VGQNGLRELLQHLCRQYKTRLSTIISGNTGMEIKLTDEGELAAIWRDRKRQVSILVAPSGWQPKDWAQSDTAEGMRGNQGRELARGCEGVFIIAFDERSSTPPRVRKGGVSGVLIVIENIDTVSISAWR
jgi:hypothetical protein